MELFQCKEIGRLDSIGDVARVLVYESTHADGEKSYRLTYRDTLGDIPYGATVRAVTIAAAYVAGEPWDVQGFEFPKGVNFRTYQNDVCSADGRVIGNLIPVDEPSEAEKL